MDALLGVGIRVNSVDLCRAPAISGLTPTADVDERWISLGMRPRT